MACWIPQHRHNMADMWQTAGKLGRNCATFGRTGHRIGRPKASLIWPAPGHSHLDSTSLAPHLVECGPFLAQIGQIWPAFDRCRPELARVRPNIWPKIGKVRRSSIKLGPI